MSVFANCQKNVILYPFIVLSVCFLIRYKVGTGMVKLSPTTGITDVVQPKL